MLRDLPTSDLPTHGDIARCFYKAFESERKSAAQVNLVKYQLENSWKSCSPELPLLAEKTVQRMLLRFMEKVKKVNRPKQSEQLVTEMENLKDKLFDISACKCSLPKVGCDHHRVHCREANCEQDHFICDCPLDIRVPAAERNYLSDQRSKVGTYGGTVPRRMANFAFVRQPLRFTSFKYLSFVPT